MTNAATVPVTGLARRPPRATAGQQISYLELAAGQSVTLSLTDCPGGEGIEPPDHTTTVGVVASNQLDSGACSAAGNGPQRGAVLFLLALAAWLARRRPPNPTLLSTGRARGSFGVGDVGNAKTPRRQDGASSISDPAFLESESWRPWRHGVSTFRVNPERSSGRLY